MQVLVQLPDLDVGVSFFRPEGIDAPPGAAVVTRDTWWAAARDALLDEAEKKARDAFRDAVEGLVGTGFVGHHKRKVFWELGQPE